MLKKIAIINSGIGNILSIINWLDYEGAKGLVVDTPTELSKADALILPGVGAFSNGMNGLRERGLIEYLREFAKTGKPFLGICLGMQMMLDISFEFKENEGLGFIPGQVLPIPETKLDGTPHKIPHICWSSVEQTNNQGEYFWNKNILKNIPNGTPFYFLHSFTCVPNEEKYRIADSNYNGRRVSAIIGKDNLFGCQFHPEKSGKNGIQFLKNFLAL